MYNMNDFIDQINHHENWYIIITYLKYEILKYICIYLINQINYFMSKNKNPIVFRKK